MLHLIRYMGSSKLINCLVQVAEKQTKTKQKT